MTAKTQGPSQSATERRQPSRRDASGQAPTAGPRVAADLAILASFKPVPSAFQLDGDGDGGQMTLVFDASQVLPATTAWATYAGQAFRLVFEPEAGMG